MKRFLLLFLVLGTFAVLTSYELIAESPVESTELRIYPSPIVNTATVSCSIPISRIEVYNLLGTMVLARDGQGEMDFTDLPRGYYLIKAISKNEDIVKRVQKQ